MRVPFQLKLHSSYRILSHFNWHRFRGAPQLVGAIIFITTLKNKVDFNEKSIDQLNTSFREADSKREDLITRISMLEQWKDVFSRDLGELRRDVDRGVSNEQVEGKLRDLEKRIYERMGNK